MTELSHDARSLNWLVSTFVDRVPGVNDAVVVSADGLPMALSEGLDRDSALIADLFDERDEAVKALLAMTIEACRKRGKYVGICGQGPSDHPDLAKWLLAQGIESVSLNPDTVVETWMFLAGQAV